MSRLDFLYRTELPHRAVAVYIYLADRTNENNECWPAIPTIASDLKFSPSTVRRGIRDLKKQGSSQPSSGTEKKWQEKFAVPAESGVKKQKPPPRGNCVLGVPKKLYSFLGRGGATEQMSFCRSAAKRIVRSLRRRSDRCHLSWWKEKVNYPTEE